MAKAKYISSWAVAAAILLIDGESFHYTTLSKAVIKTGLSKLGEKGESAPQTMKTILLTHKIDGGENLFWKMGDGDYDLADREAAKRIPLVQEALERINSFSSE